MSVGHFIGLVLLAGFVGFVASAKIYELLGMGDRASMKPSWKRGAAVALVTLGALLVVAFQESTAS